MINVPSANNSYSAPPAAGSNGYKGPVVAVARVGEVAPQARPAIRRRHGDAGDAARPSASGWWLPGQRSALKASLVAAGVLPVDVSLTDRVARLGRVYDLLLALEGSKRAYQEAGLTGLARRYAGRFVDTLDELTGADRDELLLIAIGRAAPRVDVCAACVATLGADGMCAQCAADVVATVAGGGR